MVYKIRYLPTAIKDYKEIRKYLLGYSKNTVAKFVTILNSKLDLIMENPLLYPKYTTSRPFRKMVINSDYLLFYLINKEDKIIDIYRILSSAKNVKNVLKSSDDIDKTKYLHEDNAEYD